MPVLRLFAAAREAAGEARVEFEGDTVGEVLASARGRFGEPFVSVLLRCRIWVNGQPAEEGTRVETHDVVAVLPPVSGGAGGSHAGPVQAVVVPEPSFPAPPPSPPPPVALRPPPPPPPPVAPPVAPRPDDPFEAPAAFPVPDDFRLPDDFDFQGAPPPPPPPPPQSLIEPDWNAPWPHDTRFEALPAEEGGSPDDLLDRLAGLPPWPDNDPITGQPPPPPPPSPPSPPPPLPQPDPDVGESDDSLWGPGTGPSWSVGDGDDDIFGPLPGSPAAAPPSSPDWDRRWEGPLEWENGEDDPSADGPQARLLRPVRSVPTIPFEPAVRILDPDPFIRPLAPIEPKPTPDPDRHGPPPRAISRARSGVLVGAARGGGGNGAAGAAVRLAVSDPVVRAERPAPPPLRAVQGNAFVVPEFAPVITPAPRRQKPPPLAVVPKANQPHRLGVVWVAVTAGAVVGGKLPIGIWLGACAAVAALQTARVWRARNERPLIALAGATAAALPLAAVSGPRAMTGAVAAAVILTLLTRMFSLTKAPARDVGLTLAIGVVIGLAAASIVLLRNTGLAAPLLLLTYAAAYDSSAYVVGTGARSAWEGPAAGIAMLIPITMLSAVVLVPPFAEASPLLLGAIAAVLAPCGPLAGSALLGERDANAPALRRLDSLIVLAPLWAFCAAAFLR